MTSGRRLITEEEMRIVAREKARRLKAKATADAREAKLKARGYRTFTATVPEEIHSAVSRAVKELVRKWIAAHRRAELVPPEETDPLANALEAAIANLDVSGFSPEPKSARAEEGVGAPWSGDRRIGPADRAVAGEEPARRTEGPDEVTTTN